MAVLTDAERKDAARKWIKKVFVKLGNTATVDTVAIKAAIDATDVWIDSNASSYVTALPTTFKNNSTAAQKTLLFCYVAMKRAGII